MSDTMKDLATEALRQSIDVATKTGEFIQEQAPLVVQELVRWQIASNLAVVMMFLLFALAWGWGGYRLCKKIDPKGYQGLAVTWGGSGVVLMTLGLFFALPALFSAMKWIIAPRVALLEYAASLVR